MAKFYLIGGKTDDLKSNYLEKTLVSLTRKIKPKILFFPTAMKDSKKTIKHFHNTFNNLLVDIEDVLLFDKDGDYLIEEKIIDADVLFFSGGNTDVLVNKLQELSLDKLLLKYVSSNKIYAGISAGAILFTKAGMGDSYSYVDNGQVFNYKMVKGLSFLNFYICPHYQKKDLYIFNDFTEDKELSYAIEDDTALFIDSNKKYIYKANNKNSVYEFKNGVMKPLYEDYKIHVLGPINTYSYLASIKYEDEHNIYNPIVLHKTIRKACEEIKNGDLAIIPFENTLDGYLQSTLDILYENNFEIIEDFSLRIDFSFLSDVKTSDVKNIYVQFKAKGQCVNFLENTNSKIIETNSNIESLELLNKNRGKFGSVVPTHMLGLYNYKNVEKNICDRKNNYTRFIVIKKSDRVECKIDHYKCSLVLLPKTDKAGILYNMLKMFSDYDINLNSIMSRPTKEKLGKYYFYVEFSESKNKIKNIEEVLNKAKNNNEFEIKILGFYPLEKEN